MLDSHLMGDPAKFFDGRVLDMCAQICNCVLLKAEHEAWNSAVFELSVMFIKHKQEIRELAKIK
jgi:L-asparagine transporter-like permease